MKNTKLGLHLTFALFSLVIATPSFADNYGSIVRCSTSSRGIVFTNEGRDSSLTRENVSGQCRNDQRTNNAECDANISCDDGGYSRPMISCSTTSNGLSFSVESRDTSVARTNVAGQCRDNQRTSNAECDANIICNDGQYSRPMISCSTTSNGLNFTDESRDPSVARGNVAGQCRDNQRTNNAECDANIICNDGSYNLPMITCSTFSNGINFSDESRDSSVARANVAGQCRDNQRTNNAECDANIMCSDNSSRIPPQSPREPERREPPRREMCIANRYDPAGMFVQSYRGQECSDAMKMCISEIRGRQTCNISR
jgi:hypothetical protein